MELNTTQRSTTDHGKSRAQTTCTYMWKPRDPGPNQKYLLTRFIVPRQSAVPPAISPCLASARSCLPCPAAPLLPPSYLPCQ